MSYEFTLEMCDNDKEKANAIWATSRDVAAYTQFKSAIDLGLSVGLNDVPFERALLYTWIKEGIESGRKN